MPALSAKNVLNVEKTTPPSIFGLPPWPRTFRSMNIYVGNLSPETTEDDLRRAFAAFGQVRAINIVRDRDSSESKGFGFVGMPIKDEAETAINEINGKDLKGQTINVEEGRRKTPRWVGGGRQQSSHGGRGCGGIGRQGGFRGGDRGGRRY
ncbi:MAG: RNA recognition motif domain-containing protein [Planctomycetota bacterium]|jgi:RNA recognition motif-containing protein